MLAHVLARDDHSKKDLGRTLVRNGARPDAIPRSLLVEMIEDGDRENDPRLVRGGGPRGVPRANFSIYMR